MSTNQVCTIIFLKMMFVRSLWQLPEGRVLLELVVLTAESTHSWGDTFERLCSHGVTKQYVVSRQQALNANVTPIGQFVKPVF